MVSKSALILDNAIHTQFNLESFSNLVKQSFQPACWLAGSNFFFPFGQKNLEIKSTTSIVKEHYF